MAARKLTPGMAQAVVNLAWLGRALESGKRLPEAAQEVYGFTPEGDLARDLRTVVSQARRERA